MRYFWFFFLLLSSSKLLAATSCANLLNNHVFRIKDYQGVIMPVTDVSPLSDYEQKLMDDFLYMGELMAEYFRYGESNTHRMNNLDPITLDIFKENFVKMLKKKFPIFNGVVFRSVKIEKPSGFPDIGWPSESLWQDYRTKVLSLNRGDVLSAETIWSSSKLYRVSRFFDGGPTEERVIFVIKLKNGVDLANHAGTEAINFWADKPRVTHSHEVLILPETSFEVLDVLKSRDPAVKTVIVMQEK